MTKDELIKALTEGEFKDVPLNSEVFIIGREPYNISDIRSIVASRNEPEKEKDKKSLVKRIWSSPGDNTVMAEAAAILIF